MISYWCKLYEICNCSVWKVHLRWFAANTEKYNNWHPSVSLPLFGASCLKYGWYCFHCLAFIEFLGPVVYPQNLTFSAMWNKNINKVLMYSLVYKFRWAAGLDSNKFRCPEWDPDAKAGDMEKAFVDLGKGNVLVDVIMMCVAFICICSDHSKCAFETKIYSNNTLMRTITHVQYIFLR